jgi:uncharacterized protein with GYD domain
MQTYVTLFNFTDQGAKTVADTVARVRQLTAVAEKAGGKVVTTLWTQGRFDLVSIGEWPDEETAMAFSVMIAKAGNVRSETLRAFNAEQMERILKKAL